MRWFVGVPAFCAEGCFESRREHTGPSSCFVVVGGGLLQQVGQVVVLSQLLPTPTSDAEDAPTAEMQAGGAGTPRKRKICPRQQTSRQRRHGVRCVLSYAREKALGQPLQTPPAEAAVLQNVITNDESCACHEREVPDNSRRERYAAGEVRADAIRHPSEQAAHEMHEQNGQSRRVYARVARMRQRSAPRNKTP